MLQIRTFKFAVWNKHVNTNFFVVYQIYLQLTVENIRKL